MLATGIPSTGGELPQRANNATTRIYEMGKIVTNQIEAKGGLIGNFKIVEGKNLSYEDADTKAEMVLNEEGVAFYSKGVGQTGAYVRMGNGCGGDMILQINADPNRGQYCYGPAGNEHAGIMVTSDKAAIMSDEGMFYGLRPHINFIDTDTYTATDLDHTLYVSVASSITLPTTPKAGQFYKIIKSKSLSGVKLIAPRFINLVTGQSVTAGYLELPQNATTIEVTLIPSSTPFWAVDYITH